MNAIQVMNEARSEDEAAEIMDHLAKQEGYLGGRILDTPGEPPLRVQTFHDATGVDASSPLPDGMRFVVIPKALVAELGIIVESTLSPAGPPLTIDAGRTLALADAVRRVLKATGYYPLQKPFVPAPSRPFILCQLRDALEEFDKAGKP
jgi:hypothetical protein